MEKRGVAIKIKLTETEAAKFDHARGNVRRAVAARFLILQMEPPRPPHPDTARLAAELNKIGVNLNQIARTFNEKFPNEKTFFEARNLIAKLKESLI